MAIALVLQMVMRGFDYMITGMGVAALESEGARSEEWLQAALGLQRVVWGLLFTSGVAGYVGTAIMAVGLAFRPEPVRLSPVLNGIVAVLAVASLVVFVTAWHSDRLELAFAPVFAAMSAGRTRLHGAPGVAAGVVERRPGERTGLGSALGASLRPLVHPHPDLPPSKGKGPHATPLHRAARLCAEARACAGTTRP